MGVSGHPYVIKALPWATRRLDGPLSQCRHLRETSFASTKCRTPTPQMFSPYSSHYIEWATLASSDFTIKFIYISCPAYVCCMPFLCLSLSLSLSLSHSHSPWCDCYHDTLLNSTCYTCPHHATVSVLLWAPKSQIKFFGGYHREGIR